MHAELLEFAREAAPHLPFPGEGGTWRRFGILADCAARDLSFGRLAEGHADALGILHEAGRSLPAPFNSYGVWAARGGRGEVGDSGNAGGRWVEPFGDQAVLLG